MKIKKTLSFDEEVIKKMEKICKERCLKLSALVQKMIEKWIDENENMFEM